MKSLFQGKLKLAEDLTIASLLRCSCLKIPNGQTIINQHQSRAITMLAICKKSLDLAYINLYTTLGKNLSICFKDIEQKRNSDFNQGS